MSPTGRARKPTTKQGRPAIRTLETKPPNARLLIPALRGRMGDWAYYVCLLELREVANRVEFARDLHKSERLSGIIQRGLTDHADRISNYLVRQPQRFLNSLVVAVYEGEPTFHELSVKQTLPATPGEIPELVEMNMGVLELRGDERLMALDGQHRVRGIQLAIVRNKRLGDEQIGTIFVAHKSTPVGLERTRRLFTTLNRYAKPVSQFDLIAQDEDDAVAIAVRRLIDAHSVLRERISEAAGTNLPPGDDTSLTTLPALYDAMDRIFRDRPTREWNDYKRLRPPEREIQGLVRVGKVFWDEVARRVDVVRELARDPKRRISGTERGDGGGHLLLRPVGLTSFAAAAKTLVDSGIGLPAAVQRLAALPLDLGNPPWLKVLWNPTSHRMIVGKDNKDAATAWLSLAAGAPEGRRLSAARLDRELQALDEEQAPEAMALLQRHRSAVTPTVGNRVTG